MNLYFIATILAIASVVNCATNANPFLASQYYVNPVFQKELNSSIATCNSQSLFPCSETTKQTLISMSNIASAYWLDTISKINGNTTEHAEGILSDAASQSPAPLVVFIVYDLPNRDCDAHASNGEICCNPNSDGSCNYNMGGDCAQGLQRYKTEYIDQIAKLFAQYQDRVPIVAIIEPDSLPNLATNTDNPHCGNSATQAAYMQGIPYAITTIANSAPKVTMYLDAAHGGWLGWQNNLNTFAQLVVKMDVAQYIRGFSDNVANYQPIGDKQCPSVQYCLNGQNPSDPCCSDPCHLISQYNPANNELNYVAEVVSVFKALTGWTPYFVTDTGRDGIANERSQCSNWCNIRGAGIGYTPRTNTPSPYVDAFFWLKTPGESDGCTQMLPDGSQCPRFDTMCASSDSIGSRPGEPRAPQAGEWFDYQIKMLAANARLN
eukprot:TRINITY_DN4087_c0_g1_i1.p1 TRINITY_DN4087_c0_g1~~TRINITY_DN4087_c0_g1_i1.p1  ORF type:complete len:435 (+),score=91.58 TRINITY_DN4087_c0_g1_i1:53-1357(+)